MQWQALLPHAGHVSKIVLLFTIKGPPLFPAFLNGQKLLPSFERPESMRMTTFVIAWKLLSIDYTSAYNFPNGLGKMLP